MAGLTKIMKRAIGDAHFWCDPCASLGLIAIAMGAVTYDVRKGGVILQAPAALADRFFQ